MEKSRKIHYLTAKNLHSKAHQESMRRTAIHRLRRVYQQLTILLRSLTLAVTLLAQKNTVLLSGCMAIQDPTRDREAQRGRQRETSSRSAHEA